MQMCVYLRVYSKKEAKCFEHLRLHKIIQSFLPIYMDYKYIYREREREREMPETPSVASHLSTVRQGMGTELVLSSNWLQIENRLNAEYIQIEARSNSDWGQNSQYRSRIQIRLNYWILIEHTLNWDWHVIQHSTCIELSWQKVLRMYNMVNKIQ